MTHPTTPTMQHDATPPACVPPQLCDAAAVEILNFLHVVIDLFETEYGSQIRRYYDERSQHNIVQPNPNLPSDDPPF